MRRFLFCFGRLIVYFLVKIFFVIFGYMVIVLRVVLVKIFYKVVGIFVLIERMMYIYKII